METAGKLAPLGFGFMRLPLNNADDPTSIDIDKCCELVDIFMDGGFTYFRLGPRLPWLQVGVGASRRRWWSAIRATRSPSPRSCRRGLPRTPTRLGPCSTSPLRSAASTTSTTTCCTTWARPSRRGFEEYGLWEFCAEKKAEGKIKKFGFSIHDNAEELEKVLDAHPEVDFVQLQINYVDWESDIIQSRKCYEVCQERGLPVVIMEPVKGGTLVKLPDSWPISCVRPSPARHSPPGRLRFAGSLPNVIAVLSGMNTPEMVAENVAIMRDGVPLTTAEHEVIERGSRNAGRRCPACPAPTAATA